MTDQKVILESLAMDLKRVALGLHRGSLSMAERFKTEALQREAELEQLDISNYLKKIITGSRQALLSNSPQSSEDVLMYSTLFQNYAQKK